VKHLKLYNEELIFDSSTIEDILIDIVDEGHTWDINIGKASSGSSNISIYINISSNPNIDWDKITPCALRVSDYLSQEGYGLSDNTDDIISSIKKGIFDPEDHIAGYSDFLFYIKKSRNVDPVSLELQFKKSI
jgi:hypothetical protein